LYAPFPTLVISHYAANRGTMGGMDISYSSFLSLPPEGLSNFEPWFTTRLSTSEHQLLSGPRHTLSERHVNNLAYCRDCLSQTALLRSVYPGPNQSMAQAVHDTQKKNKNMDREIYRRHHLPTLFPLRPAHPPP
jgi:hypothetical protein